MKKLFPNCGFSRFILLMCFIISASIITQATTFTVTKTADTNDNICDADCSLREAIAAANVAGSDDVIEFEPEVFKTAQTIILGGSLLTIINNGSLTINGTGANLLAISGNNLNRVIIVGNGATATINAITIRDGNGRNLGAGGGIANLGTLTLNNSVVRNNFGDPFAGGIYNEGVITITRSVISNNSATFSGGGIYNFNDRAVLSIVDSTISNNSVGRDGGGIYNNGRLNITSSTINDNVASNVNDGGSGAGIFTTGYVNRNSTVEIYNSTIANNSARIGGGGILNDGSKTTIFDSTISGNSVMGFFNTSGGGISSFSGNYPATTTARNTIIADNTVESGNGPDFLGTLNSQGFNLIENTNGTTITGVTTGNILGQDAQLLPLGNYGAVTQTVALQPNSPAIDAGDPNNFLVTDQRGISRPQDGDSNVTVLPDIGAYERQITNFTVTKTADTNDGICDADCSLREAITVTNTAITPDNTIIFAPSVFNTAQTLTLTNGQLNINKNGTFVINGTGANLLTISGRNQSRVIFVTSGVVAAINGLTITEGREDAGNGGGILNEGGTLILTNIVVRNNSSSDGGGIKNDNGILNIVNSTIKDNSGRTGGGGISNFGPAGFLTVGNSTLSGNLTDNNGGGIVNNFSNVTINNSVISNNQATGSGGGVFTGTGSLSIAGSILQNNSASDSGGAIRVSSSNNPVQISNSTLINNKATNGGGIRSGSATIILTNSSITGNTAAFRGGGIVTDGSTMTLTASTLDNNSATNAGGGIANFGSLTVTNSTITGNSSSNVGGGIFNGNGPVSLNYSTVSHNSSNVGGGISGSVSSLNSIIAENTAINSAPDYSGTLNSQGHNLVENTSGTTITGTTTGNIIGKAPLLGSLADNGGPTLTRSLLPGSPAIDAGSPSNILPTDQRGFIRPRDGDGDNVARADIGAFEVRAILVANSNSFGTGSLRQAIADAATQADAVVFNANVFSTPKTITLTDGDIVIPGNANFTINGRGADKLTISGNNRSRVFTVNAGANVVINGVTITGGSGTGSINSGHDGGISNFGSLTLSNSIVSGNSANGNGGGIGNYVNGILVVVNSTIKNNSTSTIAGGGIFNQNGQATIIRSTINNNKAAGIGGGIANILGMLTVINSTISGNSAGNGGGGISNFTAASVTTIYNSTVTNNITNNNTGGGINNNTGGVVNSRNTIIANNSAAANIGVDFSGHLTSQGYNLIKNTDDTIITGNTVGNLLNVDPLLDPHLRDNGGVTLTHALRSNSPAIDSGSTVSGISTDQRGFARPFDFPNVLNAAGGNGSDIGAFERQNTDARRNTPFDFDGDGKADISVFRPSNGVWYVIQSQNGFTAAQFGDVNDKIVPADYDGDGKTDLAVYRAGTWYLNRSSAGFTGIAFGAPDDIPQPADFDGDGKAELVVWRPSNGVWYVFNLATNSFTATQFGASTDKPVASDYDGDGKADYAVFRPSNGVWYLQRSMAGFTGIQFGEAADKTVPADYDGDGKTDIAVYRPSNGTWYLLQSTAGFTGTQFGISTDLPVPADFDGDGKADLAVFRDGIWYLLQTTNGFTGIQFGSGTDKPVPNAYIP